MCFTHTHTHTQRSQVWIWNGQLRRWTEQHAYSLSCEFPRGTILEVEIVQELKGQVHDGGDLFSPDFPVIAPCVKPLYRRAYPKVSRPCAVFQYLFSVITVFLNFLRLTLGNVKAKLLLQFRSGISHMLISLFIEAKVLSAPLQMSNYF